ncbi:MAG: fimbrillin family protein [Bacteroidaceae bacterium]|nr:fimbrillin family protein [Bacteroidaceae bacterium]
MNTNRNILALLSAVILFGMTACQNSPILVDTEIDNVEINREDKEHLISFATFANRSTRAVPTISDLEFYHPTFKVYGTKTSHEGTKIQPIFEGITVKAVIAEDAETPNTWHYDTDRYWDKQAENYQFVAFAPAHAPLGYKHNSVEVNDPSAKFFSVEDLTIVGQNLQEGAPSFDEKNTGFTGIDGADCDVMRSDAFPVPEPKTTPVVTLNFRHTLAKLLVTAKANSATPYIINIDNMQVADVLSTGAYDHTKGWYASTEDLVTYKYTAPSTALSAAKKTYFIESLVMPQEIKSSQVLTINYTITSGDYSEEFTYKATLAELFNGKATNFSQANSYTINFNIAPEQNIITFDTGITAWEEDDNNPSLEY